MSGSFRYGDNIPQSLFCSSSEPLQTEIPVMDEVIPLVESFLSSRLQDLNSLYDSLQNGNFNEIKRICHIIKGIAAPYGFPTLANLSRQIEEVCVLRDEQKVRSHLDQMSLYMKQFSSFTEHSNLS